MTDIELVSTALIGSALSRPSENAGIAIDAWKRILAERSADKARIAAAESERDALAARVADLVVRWRATADHLIDRSLDKRLAEWLRETEAATGYSYRHCAKALESIASPAPVSEPQPADPNSSATQQKDENWQPSWPDFVKAVDALVMRSGDEFDCCSWQEITSRISALQGIAKEMHELADNWPHVKYSADLDARAAAILGDRCYQPDKPLASESGEQVEVVGYWDGESEVFSKSVDSGPDDEPLVYKSNYDALRAQADALKMHAQIHAMEARGANATIADIYQLCTGATGEPGNWNGADPVRKLLARAESAERERDRLRDQLAQSCTDMRAENHEFGSGQCPIARDLLAAEQRYHERLKEAERERDAIKRAASECPYHNGVRTAGGWITNRVAEIIGGAK